MLQLQLYINDHATVLDRAISEQLPGTSVRWVSPLRSDRYREYQDEEFLARLGLPQHIDDLASFWPRGGPCWDGLGLWSGSGRSGPLLVEAKSYPEEAFSTLAAQSARSRNTIANGLTETADWLGLPQPPSSWTIGRYQAANRIAHLYFLRERCGLDAYLVFLCMVNDPHHQPTGLGTWQRANEVLWNDLGLKQAPPNTGVVYLPGLQRPTIVT